MSEYITIQEMVRKTGISSKEKIKRLALNGKINIIKIDGRDMISEDFIDAIKSEVTISQKINTAGISFKAATLNEQEFLKSLMIEGVETGHYKQKLISDEEQFNKTVESLILGEQDIKRQAIPQTALVYYNDNKLGFITTASFRGGVVEFWYMSLSQSYQNKGYGTKIIYALEEMYSNLGKKDHPIFVARCSHNSQAMIRVFTKLGYDKKAYKDDDGEQWYLLAKSKDYRYKEILQFDSI